MTNIELHMNFNKENGIVYTLKEKRWNRRIEDPGFLIARHRVLREIDCQIKGSNSVVGNFGLSQLLYPYGRREKPYLYFLDQQQHCSSLFK